MEDLNKFKTSLGYPSETMSQKTKQNDKSISTPKKINYETAKLVKGKRRPMAALNPGGAAREEGISPIDKARRNELPLRSMFHF